ARPTPLFPARYSGGGLYAAACLSVIPDGRNVFQSFQTGGMSFSHSRREECLSVIPDGRNVFQSFQTGGMSFSHSRREECLSVIPDGRNVMNTSRTTRLRQALFSLPFGLLFLLMIYPSPSWAWGDLGHKIICEIAFQELNDRART